MELHETLGDAIARRQAILFRYEGSDGSTGERIGSPHVLYVMPRTENIICDINQHSGASASANKQSFKQFLLVKMSAVEIAPSEEFRQFEHYAYDAERYVNSIARID